MLTTRCPDCQTTFKITSVALHTAAGKVRCGQCSHVFDAFDSLTDTLTHEPVADLLRSTLTEPLPHTATQQIEPPQSPAAWQQTAAQAQPQVDWEVSLQSDPLSPEAVQAEVELPDAAVTDAPPADVEPADAAPTDSQEADATDAAPQSAETETSTTPTLPDEEVDEVLDDAPLPQQPWHPSEPTPQPESPAWRIAAAVATVVLALQGVHHFRAAIAQTPYVGSAVQSAYALVGMPIVAQVDPADFSIVNWVATAQTPQDTAEEADGSLEISAGVRNTSDGPLPYPLLSLELTDRWEEIIAARVFTPDEYMGTRLSGNARIRPNTTVTAQLQLVDPGPSAYGFQVDICVALDAERMHCKKAGEPFQ